MTGDDLIEAVARALCIADGKNPDETWEEFDRTAAATQTMCGGVSDDEIFPKVIRWEEYKAPAHAALSAVWPHLLAMAAEPVISWADDSPAMLLACGEMTASERRTVKAVLRNRALAIMYMKGIF